MVIPAVWMQETDTISFGNAKLLMVFIGLVAISMAVQAIAMVALSIKGLKTIKELSAIVVELKAKVIPLIDKATHLSVSAQALITENAPKLKVITDNLVDTSKVVKTQAQQLDKTVTDANLRTQKQVARIDGMVTAALTTTAEIVEAVNHGIRVPAHKIAVMVTQAKLTLEGVMDKVKAKASGHPSNR